MKVLITGGSGFLGKHLTKIIRAEGHEVHSLASRDCDLTVQGNLEKLNVGKLDMIFHLAAWSQAGDFCLKHAGEQWVVNQAINTNVIAYWWKQQPQAKMIAAGTSGCYAGDATNFSETSYLEGQPAEVWYTYGMCKRLAYIGLKSLSKQFGLKYLTVVPSTMYGTQYAMENKNLHFIFDVTRKILSHKHHGSEVVLWGDGSQRRELVHVSDFADATWKLAQRHENELVNIGGGQDYSIRDFAEMVCRAAKVDPAIIKYDTSKYVGAKSKILNIEKLERLVPDRQKTSIEQGITEMVLWMEANYFEKAGRASSETAVFTP